MHLSSWKKFVFPVFLAIVASSSQTFAGCAVSVPAGADKILPRSGINQTLLSSAIVGQINAHRCRSGRAALQAVAGLRSQAASHSKWMAGAGQLSHKATKGYKRSLTDRLKASGVRFRTGAENIGFVHYYQVDDRRFTIRSAQNCVFLAANGHQIPQHSYKSIAELIVQKWMESPGHRKNILNSKHKFTGAGGEVKGNGSHCGLVFLTQIFAG